MPGVSIPIIDQLVHPSYGLVSTVALPGNPYSPGSLVLVPPQNALIALTYGIHWSIGTVASGRGYKIGTPNVFDDRVLQLAVDYTFLGGAVHIAEWVDLYAEIGVWWWSEALPSHLYVQIDPALTLNLFYLQT
jgi:hypothetical protein